MIHPKWPFPGETIEAFTARFMAAEIDAQHPDGPARRQMALRLFNERVNGIPLPTPVDDETEEAYVTRFNALPEMADVLGDLRSAAAAFCWMRRHNGGAVVSVKRYQSNFIEPGLVKYEDVERSGNVLVRKATLDRMAPSMVGQPVINMLHETPSPEEWRKNAAGIVTRVWFEPTDGQYWCEYLVWDPEIQAQCDLGADTAHTDNPRFSVSCAYDPLDGTETGGEWHSIPYEGEITDGRYTHLAIVPNPRYEAARIYRCNSKGGSPMMKLFGWLKGTKTEIDPDTEFEVDGEKTTISKLVADRKNATEALAKIETARKNAEDEEEKKRKEEEERKNAQAELDKAHADGKHDEKPLENCTRCNERKNAEAAEEAKRKEDEQRKNAKHFQDLEDARRKAQTAGKDTVIETSAEVAARGRELYGSKKK